MTDVSATSSVHYKKKLNRICKGILQRSRVMLRLATNVISLIDIIMIVIEQIIVMYKKVESSMTR